MQDICRKHGIVFIADEVQSGFARTGKWFASEHFGIEPDLITMAKSMGGGMPIAAVTGRAEIMDAPGVGGLGGTYCGHPAVVRCRRWRQSKRSIKKGCLRDRRRLANGLKRGRVVGKQKWPLIGDVRGPWRDVRDRVGARSSDARAGRCGDQGDRALLL